MPADKDKVIRKLRAILSADVKGYSILMADDEVHTIQTLKAYRQIMSNLIKQHSGRVVDSPGDNMLVEFSSAVDAVRCAVEIQKELKKENARYVEDKKLQFRIGVNIGDVVQDGDRIYGNGVNVAARIEGISGPGGICISRNTYDHVKDKLELGFEFLGEHKVKNINEPVRVYKILMDFDPPVALLNEPFELPGKPSIAVLPFDNMSGDPNQEYFSDGLTEQIIYGLCKVKDLFVIARNSSFAYKRKSTSVKQIAQELGVKYILEGSVQRAGDRVRITAQLIDATTDYHMWSESYDRNLTDIFALQDEITMKLISAIGINLTLGEQGRLWAEETGNISAYDNWMRGMECFYRLDEKNNAQARQFYKKAISLDKTYSMPYVVLGFTHLLDFLNGWGGSPLQSFEQAEKSVENALTLNDSLDLAHGLLGWILLFKRQHEEAIKKGKRAVELNPNGAESHAVFAFILILSGKPEEAIKLLNRAIRLNPIPPSFYYSHLGLAYRVIGRYNKSIGMCKMALRDSPDLITPNLTLASCYSFLNRLKKASIYVKEILRINPNFSLDRYAKIIPYKNDALLDPYMESLRKAGLPE